MLILSAEDKSGQPAAQSLTTFVQSTGPVGVWMDRIAAVR
jgi:hypothetical protein